MAFSAGPSQGFMSRMGKALPGMLNAGAQAMGSESARGSSALLGMQRKKRLPGGMPPPGGGAGMQPPAMGRGNMGGSMGPVGMMPPTDDGTQLAGGGGMVPPPSFMRAPGLMAGGMPPTMGMGQGMDLMSRFRRPGMNTGVVPPGIGRNGGGIFGPYRGGGMM